MAQPIPLIGAPKPEQPEQLRVQVDAQVLPEITVFRMQTGPFDVRLQPVPNDIMAGVVHQWLLQHPQDAILIISEVKKQFKQAADIAHTVQLTKN